MKYLGCSYYPESLGLARVGEDIKLMKELGINIVRMGEFAWSKMEKREGEYDFELFRKTSDAFWENGIGTMMCTPTATPPAWLTHNHPETLVMDPVGHRAIHGIRQQCCYNSEVYREYCAKITDKMSKALSGCAGIMSWQIDNELGQRLQGACSCGSCQRDFREYIKSKYKTIDELNERWKNVFWSEDYSDWEEITLAFPECLWDKSPKVIHFNYSVSRVMDSLRFYDKIVTDYAMAQKEIISRNMPGVKITTNNPCGVFDIHEMFKELDFAAADFYWDNREPARMAERLAHYRSYKGKKFFIAETGIGYDYTSLPDGQRPAKLDMWRSFAHGADAYIFFLWRPFLGGQEQCALTPVSPAGKPRRTYQVVKDMFGQVAELKEKLGETGLPKSEAAILFDGDTHRSYLKHGYGKSINYWELTTSVFAELHKRNIAATFVYPESPLDGYKLLILPSQRIIRKELSEKIREFVKNGGVVWAISELNTADENGNFTTNENPVELSDVFGITIHTGAALGARIAEKDKVLGTRVEGTIGGEPVKAVCDARWIADLEARKQTDVLLKFADGYYHGQDAVTCNKFGKGKAFYQGIANIGAELLSKMAETVIDTAKIERFKSPAGVEVIDCGNAVFVINSNDKAVAFKLPVKGKALRGAFDPKTSRVKIGPVEVCIIKRA